MQGLGKAASLVIGTSKKRAPLCGLQAGRSEDGRGNSELVSSKAFEKTERKRQCSNCAGGSRAEWLVDIG